MRTTNVMATTVKRTRISPLLTSVGSPRSLAIFKYQPNYHLLRFDFFRHRLFPTIYRYSERESESNRFFVTVTSIFGMNERSRTCDLSQTSRNKLSNMAEISSNVVQFPGKIWFSLGQCDTYFSLTTAREELGAFTSFFFFMFLPHFQYLHLTFVHELYGDCTISLAYYQNNDQIYNCNYFELCSSGNYLGHFNRKCS